MEILALKLSLSEQDLNYLLRKYVPADLSIEDLSVRLAPNGLILSGVYPLFINVHFETRWALGIEQGKITARLDNFKAMGVPGNIFKSAIVKMIEDLAKSEPWIRIQGDTIWVDVDACLSRYAIPTQTHFKVLECQTGRLVLEA